MKPIEIAFFVWAIVAFIAGCGERTMESEFASRKSSSGEPASSRDDRSSRMVQVEKWFEADSMYEELEAWRSRWPGQVKEATMIGGCDCHVALFRIRATQGAVNDLPEHNVRFQGDDSPNKGVNPSPQPSR